MLIIAVTLEKAVLCTQVVSSPARSLASTFYGEKTRRAEGFFLSFDEFPARENLIGIQTPRVAGWRPMAGAALVVVYNGASPQRWRPPSNAPRQPNTIESHSHVTSNCELDVVAGTSISSRKVSKAFSTPSASARPGAQQVVALLVNSFFLFSSFVSFRFSSRRL